MKNIADKLYNILNDEYQEIYDKIQSFCLTNDLNNKESLQIFINEWGDENILGSKQILSDLLDRLDDKNNLI